VEQHAEELAWLDTLNAGLPLGAMRADVRIGVDRVRLFADLGLSLGGRTIPASENGVHLTYREPFGVVARIIPFNHPLMFSLSKIAAPLVAGNCVVLKPSELTPLSALRIGELAGQVLPPGVLSVVHGGPDAGDALVRHRAVRRIAFTGSHQVGRAIQQAGAQEGVKSVSLELGGKNAMLVFPDADLGAAVAGAVKGMNFNFAGQSCGSTSRVLVHRSIADEFTARYAEAVSALRVGVPWHDGVGVGPVVSARQQERVRGFIERAISDGARLVAGGLDPVGADGGFFVAPTVFADVQPDSELGREEVFGPVVSVMTFDEESEALEIANAVEYGLTGSIWTSDLARAHRLAKALDVGFVWVNDTSTHWAGVPFGGSKSSGVGREESMDEILDYTEVKSVSLVFA
jgi:2-formylbenzoate dehydrogenase